MKKERTVDLALLGFLVYFASYVTRINYGAVISEIVFTEGIAKSSASLAVTASFITYGIGQLFSGYLGDKTNPKKLIFLGLLSSSLFNLLLPLCLSPLYTCAVWAINGFSQSLIWPPLVKILAENLTAEKYKKACVTVSAASSIGTVAVYLFSPVIIRIFSWKAVFFGNHRYRCCCFLVFGGKTNRRPQEARKTKGRKSTFRRFRKNYCRFRADTHCRGHFASGYPAGRHYHMDALLSCRKLWTSVNFFHYHQRCCSFFQHFCPENHRMDQQKKDTERIISGGDTLCRSRHSNLMFGRYQFSLAFHFTDAGCCRLHAWN